jgi:hypothetical protein
MSSKEFVPQKDRIIKKKSGPKKPSITIFTLLFMIFLVDIAIFGALFEQDEDQNDTAYGDMEPQKFKLTYEKSLTYSDGKNENIDFKDPKAAKRNLRGESYSHPLTNDTTIMFELDEIAVGTLELNEYGTLKVFDDAYNQLHEIHRGNFSAENEKGADMVCGNFDDDPALELVLSYEIDVLENNTLVSKTQVTFFDDANSRYEIINESCHCWKS